MKINRADHSEFFTFVPFVSFVPSVSRLLIFFVRFASFVVKL